MDYRQSGGHPAYLKRGEPEVIMVKEAAGKKPDAVFFQGYGPGHFQPFFLAELDSAIILDIFIALFQEFFIKACCDTFLDQIFHFTR